MWLNRRSKFVWTDDSGQQHDVTQGEGGEQGDALMPALFCLAMRPALEEIQQRLAPGDLVVAYLDDVYILTRPERHVRRMTQQQRYFRGSVAYKSTRES